MPRSQVRTAGRKLARQGRVVESGGEAVVRFPVECTLSGGSCCGCRSSSREPQIPLGWLDGVPDARAGELVTVEVAVDALTRMALMVFAVPLSALLAGAWIGWLAGAFLALGTDTMSAVTGFLCLGLAWVVMARHGAAMVGKLKLTAHRQGKHS